ncbi:MAG: hypothetical protein R3F43_21045 [bacterium]
MIIIERLGRFHRVAQSGLRFCLPFLDSPKQPPPGAARASGRPLQR